MSSAFDRAETRIGACGARVVGAGRKTSIGERAKQSGVSSNQGLERTFPGDGALNAPISFYCPRPGKPLSCASDGPRSDSKERRVSGAQEC